jgi:hypothetical protein
MVLQTIHICCYNGNLSLPKIYLLTHLSLGRDLWSNGYRALHIFDYSLLNVFFCHVRDIIV